MRRWIFVLLSLSITPTTLAEVLVVDPPGTPGALYTSVTIAVDAATDGDVIVVRGAGHGAFTVERKSLVIAGDPALTPLLQGRVTIRNLRRRQQVVLKDLQIAPALNGGIHVDQCEGPVWVEGVRVDQPYLPVNAVHGITVQDSTRVSLHDCRFVGSRAVAEAGAAGLLVERSEVYAFGCEFMGGTAFDLPSGPGAVVRDALLEASGCSIWGGDGAPGVASAVCLDHNGATGLEVQGRDSVVRLEETEVRGGVAPEPFFSCPGGVPGEAELVFDGRLIRLPGSARTLNLHLLATPSATLRAEYRGPSEEFVWLMVSPEQSRRGVLLPDPTQASMVFLGMIRDQGFRQRRFELPGTPEGSVFFFQAIARSALTGPRTIRHSNGRFVRIPLPEE